MALETKPLSEITQDDLDALIRAEVREGRTIEYKRELGKGNDEGREFLADVSSFANTAGGHLLLGVHAEGGEPKELGGLRLSNPDQYVQDLDNRLRDGIDPHLPSLGIHVVSLANGDHVVVIRLARSLTGPHMVDYKGGGFYARNSNGKYPMDVTELRHAFLRSADFAERARAWRRDRIQSLFGGVPAELRMSGPVMVLHVAPFTAFEAGTRIDLAGLPGDRIFPLAGRVQGSRYNFDGLLTYDDVDEEQRVGAYTQFYRNGCVEGVRVLPQEPSRLPIDEIEQHFLAATQAHVENLFDLDVPPPAAVMLSLLGVRGYEIPQARLSPQAPIDRDDLLVPEVIIEHFDEWRDDWLRPAFDAIWNAGGHEACPHFDEKGTWYAPIKPW